MISLAEELLLLSWHDEKGTVLSSASMSLQYGLSGAVLMELSLMGRLHIDKKNLVVVDATPTGDDILDEALTIIKHSKRKRNAQYWVSKLSREIKNLKERLLNRLIHKGILKKEEHRILWVFPSQRYPTEDAKVEQEVRDGIRAIILDGKTPEPRMAVLISLVNACNLVGEIFSREERKVARKRVKEIAKSNLIGMAVSDTVAGIQVAISAAIAATVVASSSSSSC
ncbi:MAG: GPP34 family phosphoprotein [bacterium]